MNTLRWQVALTLGATLHMAIIQLSYGIYGAGATMATLDGTTRKLTRRLIYSEDMESVVGDEDITNIDLSSWSESDPDVKISIVLNLSLNEYIALASTVDVGRDIAYGDHSIFIWWLWVRSLESMAICDAIIACINDPDSGVADTIISISNGDTFISEFGQSQSGLLFADGNNTGCSKDVWFGGIEHLVDSLDENNLDALQILEVATNVTEWITDVVAGVFGIKAPVIQSLLEWGLYIQNNILENYEAQITQQYKETLVCDLLCIAMENCKLTPQMLVDYFFERLSSQLTFGSLLTESLEFIVLGVWTGTEIADAMMLSQLVFRAQFGRWFQDVAFNSIDVDIRLGFDNDSDDWILICDTCGWTWNDDFANSENIWVVNNNGCGALAVYTPAVGYEYRDANTCGGSFGRILGIKTANFTPRNIQKITVNFDYVKGSFENGVIASMQIVAIRNDNSLIMLNIQNSDMTNGNGKIEFLNVNENDIKAIRFFIRSSSRPNQSYSGNIILNSVTVTGDGDNPFI